MKNDIPPFFDPAALPNHADLITKEDVRHYYTDEEMHELKEAFFKINLHKVTRESLIAKLKTLISSGVDATQLSEQLSSMTISDIGTESLKVLKQHFDDLLTKISNKYEDRNQQVYGVAFHDIGVMAFYNAEGYFIYKRPLRPTEQQANILSLSKSK